MTTQRVGRWIVAAAVLGAAAPCAAIASDTPMQPLQTGRHAGTMNVPLNKSQVLRVDRPYAKALIGNAEIADVTPINSSSIYILGKKLGSTNLTLYDRARNLIAVIDLVIGPDADGLKRQLFDVLPNERVGVRVSNDALILDGKATSAGAADRIAQIAETYAPGKIVNLMSTGAPQQVLLEVRFSEMQRSTVKSLGIQTLSFSSGFVPTASGGQTRQFSGASGDVPNNTFGSFGGAFNLGPLNINLQLDALEQKGLVTTLAQPNLVALSGETATFLAGGEFPIPVSSSAGAAGSVPTIGIEFKSFGVLLGFTPTVLEDGTINLLVAPEVSAIDPTVSITLNSITIPGLKVRRAKTTLELHDGESFAMAGLIQSNFNDTVRALPLLGRIPILGTLFRSSSFNRGETELVITVTPRLVRPSRPGELQYPTDRIQAPSDIDLLLNGKTEKRVPAVAGRQASATPPGGIDGPYGHIVR